MAPAFCSLSLLAAAGAQADGNYSLVPNANCTARVQMCYQGALPDVTTVSTKDPVFFCKGDKSDIVEGTCADHGYGDLFLNPDPVYTHTTVWKKSAARSAAAPYAGQTGSPGSIATMKASNCWTNVTLNATGRRALVVTTSHGEPLSGGMATGVAMEEAAEPYYVYLDAGMTVDVASILGGSIPHSDSPKTPGVKRFLADDAATAKFATSLKIDDVDFTQYDVVFMSGGWGAAFDLGYSVALGQRVAAALAAGKPLISSTCHGALGFVQANKTDGTPWVKGLTMTGVTNDQLTKLGITDQTPMHPEEELRALGANYQCIHGKGLLGDIAAESVSVDLSTGAAVVTGQNQGASCVTAQRQLLFLLSAARA